MPCTGRVDVTLQNPPVVRAQMLIRTPVAEVFEAFVDPNVTTKFWFTKSSGRLELGTNSVGLGNVWRIRTSQCKGR